MLKTVKFAIWLCLILALNSCKKTYEGGPVISLRSKMNRITGKWRLVSMKRVPRLNPNMEQYIEFTKEEISKDVYRVYYTNFQEEFCKGLKDSLFTCSGTWHLFEGAYGKCGDIIEYLEKNEGLFTTMSCNDSIDNMIRTKNSWKIKRLTNKELIIWTDYCSYFASCYYGHMFYGYREMTFEKVK